MADKVLFQSDDDLSETNLSEVLALENISGYVDRGLGFTADFVNNTLTIATGHAIVEDSNQAYHLFPDERTGLSLTDATTNHVFITHDPTVDEDISYHIDTDDSPPSNPSLKVGTVDTSADTTTELNRDPPVDYVERIVDSSSTTSFTTAGEDLIVVDTGDAAVTGTLASADATLGESIEFRLVDGSNALTIDTEAAETIDPGGASSITVSQAGWTRVLSSDGTNWDADRDAEFNSVTADEATIANATTSRLFKTTLSDSFSETFTVNRDEQNVDYVIITEGFAVDTAGPILQLSIPGIGSGNYEWTEQDEAGTLTSNTSNDQYNLFSVGTDNRQGECRHIFSFAEFRPMLYLVGASGVDFDALYNSTVVELPNEGDITATLSIDSTTGGIDESDTGDVEVRKIVR